MSEEPLPNPAKTPRNNLQSDIKKFADGLPDWGKLLAQKILSGKDIADADINNSYQVLLEELKIIPETKRTKIDIKFGSAAGAHHPELKFDELKETKGINALAEDQVLKLGYNLTILYGTNGSGKSGYARLLKKVFYSKSPEDILHNIHLDRGHKNPSAEFEFTTGGKKLKLKYPEDKTNPAFSQFSVFDGKGVLVHLDEKNALGFRPTGLSFFSQYTNAVKELEAKLLEAVRGKQGINPFPDMFDGDSEVKILLNGLSANTKIEQLHKYLPFTKEDQQNKKKAETDYDNVLVLSKGKDKEIAQLEAIKKLLLQTKDSLEKLNKFFSEEALKKVYSIISDCNEKERLAKVEGVEGFKTALLEGIGSLEWKNFITAANDFAKKQKANGAYPAVGNPCLLCQQPLAGEATELIKRYWEFIKSEAEKNASDAKTLVQKTKSAFDQLAFDLLPEGNVLTVWMRETKGKQLDSLTAAISELKILRDGVSVDLGSKIKNERKSLQIDSTGIDSIVKTVDASIMSFKGDAQQKEIAKHLGAKTLFAHREKLQQRIKEVEAFVDKQVWIKKASSVSWNKRAVTDTEKYLSGKYFNQQYIDTFNEECKLLDGSFGIVVNHTGAAGASYRQLSLKGNSPSSVLSEGEQKVIAIADFIAEMRMSEINKGLVFDDPVNSLDDGRKRKIAERLATLSTNRQVIIFTHDLVFVSAITTFCEDNGIALENHWIENRDNVPGHIWLLNSPASEENYKNARIPKETLAKAKEKDCPPAQREFYIRQGFTEIRTCYEVLVSRGLFNNVIGRFVERISIERLLEAVFDKPMIEELIESYALCCRFMEGHSHSDKYAYQKPDIKDLNDEIIRFETMAAQIRKSKKDAAEKK